MEKIVVQGGDNRLVGSVTIEGAKNAVLPLLAATILASKGKTVLQNVPILSDVFTMNQVVRSVCQLGCPARYHRWLSGWYVQAGQQCDRR